MSYAGRVRVTHLQNVTLHPSIVADFDDQLSRHHRAAFGWALACCRWDRTAAEDVLHTAYLKLMDGRARFDGHAQFRTFLFGVIRRTASEERRRRVIRETLSLGVLRREPDAESVRRPDSRRSCATNRRESSSPHSTSSRRDSARCCTSCSTRISRSRKRPT